MIKQLDHGVAPRYSLTVDTQFIEWPSDGGIPIVDFVGCCEELDVYDSKDEALIAIENYLAEAGASAEWSDVRPIETCACCKGDVDTLKSHKVLSLWTLTGPDQDATTLDVHYPARFCNTCAPINASGGAT